MLPSSRRIRRLAGTGVAIAAMAGALLAPAAAAGRTITVGSPLQGSYGLGVTVLASTTTTVANTALADPEASVFSPVDGVVRRWRLVPQAAADSFALRVLRPTGTGTYTGAGTSSPMVASTTEIKTATTNLPIKAGDLIGLEALKTSPSFRTASTPSLLQAFWAEPDLADGATAAPVSASGFEFGYNAQVEPAPRVTLIAPASGPLSGGTTVVIAGRDFTGATGVKFGSVPASSFAVNSELQITAVAPPAAAPGPVDISVTGAAGTSPAVAGDHFTYVAPAPAPPPLPPTSPSPARCVVPKLLGKNLKVARKALAGADCKLGTVAGKRGKRAKVVRQNPKPGTAKDPGAAVSVKLG